MAKYIKANSRVRTINQTIEYRANEANDQIISITVKSDTIGDHLPHVIINAERISFDGFDSIRRCIDHSEDAFNKVKKELHY